MITLQNVCLNCQTRLCFILRDKVEEFWTFGALMPVSRQATKYAICGLQGLLFHDKTWIGIKTEDIDSNKELAHVIRDIQDCSDNMTLPESTKDQSISLASHTVMSLFMEKECLTQCVKIPRKIKLNPEDRSVLRKQTKVKIFIMVEYYNLPDQFLPNANLEVTVMNFYFY